MQTAKIAKDFYIPMERIKYYVGYATFGSVKRDVQAKRKQGLVIDVTAGKKIATVIYLMTGELVLTNVSVDTIHSRIEKKEGE